MDADLRRIKSSNGSDRSQGWIAGNEVENAAGHSFDRWVDGVKSEYFQPDGMITTRGLKNKIQTLGTKGANDLYVRPDNPDNAAALANNIIDDLVDDGFMPTDKRVFLVVGDTIQTLWPR